MFPIIPLPNQQPMGGIDLTQGFGAAVPPPTMPMMPPAAPMMPPAVMDPAAQQQGVVAPPMSPWQRLVQTFQNDRSLQMGLLQMGLQMMQPVQPGQTTAGHFAQAVGSGVNTIGSVKEKDRTAQLQERQMKQTDTRIGLDEQRVELERRRVAEGEKSGAVGREAQLQQIEENRKKFPLTIKELEGRIEKMAKDGELDDARKSVLLEEIRYMPEKIQQEWKRLSIAEKAGDKPGASERLLEAVARASASNQGLTPGTPEYQKAYNEKFEELGGAALSRTGGGSSASERTLESYMGAWKTKNPKKEGESEADYAKRVAAAQTTYMTEKKQGSYRERLTKAMAENAAMLNTPERRQAFIDAFDQAEKHADAKEGAGATQAAGKGDKVTKARIKEDAKILGVTPESLEAQLKAKGVVIAP